MSSVGKRFAQPVTRTFVVTQDPNQGEQGAYFFSQTDINTWYTANKTKVNKLGESLYIIPGSGSGKTFYDVLTGNNGATELNHSLPTINERKNLIDMGKEVVFGDANESRLFVLHKVKQYGNSVNPNDALIGYVVSENNASDLYGNTGRFSVRVARI